MYSIFGNSTDIVSWVDNPHRRGTLEILSSCTVTIFICVWTALHLNLPHQTNDKQSWYAKRQLWRKIGWLIVALLAPEIAVYTAWSQHREAKALKKLNIKVKKKIHDLDERSQSDLEEWGMVHSFYAIMGGFVIDIGSKDPFIPGHRKRMTLTAKGIQFIAERFPTLLPDLSEADIRDKSKAGALAKFIVCIQAGWFVMQCISRVAMALPITLLELNTLGHSVCAIVIYLFWWNKPLDVEQPVPIRGEQAEHLLAFFWMTTDGLPVAYRGENKRQAEVRYLNISSHEDKPLPTKKIPDKASITGFVNERRQWNRTSVWAEFSNILLADQAPWKSHFARSKARDLEMAPTATKLTKGKKLANTNIRNEHEDVLLKQEDVRRWQMAEDLLTEEFSRRSNADWQATVTDRSRNWPSIDVDPRNLDWRLLLAFNASGVLYGGLHVLAWHAKFPTWSQQYLWRFASLFIVSFVPASTMVLLTEKLFFMVVNARIVGHRATEGFFNLLYRYKVWHILFVSGLLGYLWARVYLVVECFISLFHSPIEVYTLPAWSAYVPHIT